MTTPKAKAPPKKPKLTVTRASQHADPRRLKVTGGIIDMDAMTGSERLAAASLVPVFLAAGMDLEFVEDGES